MRQGYNSKNQTVQRMSANPQPDKHLLQSLGQVAKNNLVQSKLSDETIQNETPEHHEDPGKGALASIQNIKTGNQKKDILDSKGDVYARQRFMREERYNIRHEIDIVLKKKGINAKKRQEIFSNDRMDALISRLFEIGNCHEFARMVYWHIMENTTGHSIYLAAMVGKDEDGHSFDHAFTIYAPGDWGKLPTTETVKTMIDDTSVRVADGWASAGISTDSVTLKDFCGDGKMSVKGSNPYHSILTEKNIKIVQGGLSNGEKIIDDSLMEELKSAVLAYYERKGEYARKEGKKVYKNLKKGNKVDGVYE